MTAYYKSSTANSQKYRRCFEVNAKNPHGGSPSIVFREEDIVIINGKKEASTFAGDPALFGLEGPDIQPTDDDGNPVGPPVPRAYLYAVLYGAYVQARDVRDAIEVAEAKATAERIAAADAGR